MHERKDAMSGNDTGTRERILDTAATLFMEHGYAESPLSAIAKEIGITKASLYYHFPSKDSILVALVSPLLDRIDALLDGMPEHFDTFDERWAFMLAYIDVLRSDPRAIGILSRMRWGQDDETQRRIRWHRDRTVALATPPDADDEEQVRAMLGMDMIHRELVFTSDRMVLQDIPVDRRQELVTAVVQRLLQPVVAAT